jgi:hypothetical protein
LSHSFLTSVVNGCEWLMSRLGRFTPVKERRYSLNRRLLPSTGIRTPDRPARSLAAVRTTILRIRLSENNLGLFAKVEFFNVAAGGTLSTRRALKSKNKTCFSSSSDACSSERNKTIASERRDREWGGVLDVLG